MRRILLLVGLPVLLIVIWKVKTTDTSTSAIVEIDTTKVAELRSAVISRLGTIGAVKVGEQTSFSDGNADLVFKVPTARLEEALAELNVVGGEVTSQRIDLGDADESAQDLGDQVRAVQTCIGRASSAAGGSASAKRDALSTCEQQLRSVSNSLSSASTDLESTDLRVSLHTHDPITWWLTLAVALFVVALVVMGVTTVRSIRRDRMIDITDEPVLERSDDLYLRRN